MSKLLILIIILFINFILVSSQDTDSSSSNSNSSKLDFESEILKPTKEGVENVFDLMAYGLTNDYFFIQYLITYSVITLFSIPTSFYFSVRAFTAIVHLHNEHHLKTHKQGSGQSYKFLKWMNSVLDKSVHKSYSFVVQIIAFFSFIVNLVFFIMAYNRHYVYHLAFVVILFPSILFIVYSLIEIICASYYKIVENDLEKRIESLEYMQSGKRLNIKNRKLIEHIHSNVRIRSVTVKVVGICSQFLFCTIAAPDSLWIKIFLTCVAIYVTITENLDELISEVLDRDAQDDEAPDVPNQKSDVD
ncbi:27307_t:CDS:2 [Dentiscutata erythropus]|uniref:27307_t:CDS:1 n=1 Tax=Dentiscutata erythropus TaxID=1348616 RepID=A0A9N9B2R6_9GLOM|nr:27307_t:CDS:2 [Dentiscutata erythropus]